MKKRVMLDNVRSAHNVGSVFRTCDGAGVDRLYLVGTTPAPVDRFGRVQPEIAKTSLGATESVAWESVGTADSFSTEAAVAQLRQLQIDGYTVVVVEQTPEAISLYDFAVPDKVVYVLGAEVTGVHPDIIAVANAVVEIPMKGIKESLNVSVTTGIVLFHK